MILKRYTAFVALSALALMTVFTAGCGREETACAPVQTKDMTPEERLAENRRDAAKVNDAMKDARLAARGLEVAKRRIKSAEDAARAALGTGATDAQVHAELEKNPVKYPDWKRALADRDQLEERLKQGLAKGRGEARRLLMARNSVPAVPGKPVGGKASAAAK